MARPRARVPGGSLDRLGRELWDESRADIAKYSSVSWSVRAMVTVPVFDTGKRRETVRRAEAQREQGVQTTGSIRPASHRATRTSENALGFALSENAVRAASHGGR